MKRLFVAIDISSEARQRALEYTTELAGSFPKLKVRWVSPEKLHLTLKFLRNTKEESAGPLTAALSAIAARQHQFQISLTGTGTFPDNAGSRVLWLGVANIDELQKIASEIEAECLKLGFESEHRNFNPHLTIARIREPRSAGELAAKHLSNNFEAAAFKVRELALYESRLLPSGPIYNKIGVFPLTAS